MPPRLPREGGPVAAVACTGPATDGLRCCGLLSLDRELLLCCLTAGRGSEDCLSAVDLARLERVCSAFRQELEDLATVRTIKGHGRVLLTREVPLLVEEAARSLVQARPDRGSSIRRGSERWLRVLHRLEVNARPVGLLRLSAISGGRGGGAGSDVTPQQQHRGTRSATKVKFSLGDTITMGAAVVVALLAVFLVAVNRGGHPNLGGAK
jgi:hypothetical protein